ncbi:hypothetical protein MMC17_000739 [Xylographa soralifera]|nr:hypothetical protein [Xylographa soralifera]
MVIASTFWFLMIHALHIVFATPAPDATRAVPPVHFINGGFSLESCSVYYSTVMHNVLKASRLALSLAIKDLSQHRLNSSYGFEAMFKTEENMYKVYSVLLNMETGHSSAHHTSPTRSKAAPRFVCVTPEITSIPELPGLNPYEHCQIGDTIAAYVRPSRYILLCERFWSYLAAPEPGSRNCPSVANNEFVDDQSSRVSMYQSYLVIHEMVHYYLQEPSLNQETNPPEVYDLNECVALSATDSERNPSNYQFYVAFVQQNCTQAPNPSLPPFSQSS